MKSSTTAVCLLAFSFSTFADSRKVTIFHTAPATNEIQIGEFESFKVVSSGRTTDNLYPAFYFLKGGKWIDFSGYDSSAPIQLTGPASVTLETSAWNNATNFPGATWLTLEIEPQTYDVNKSITLAPGAGASITLEKSTNLVNWNSATNGVYIDIPSAMFFRIKAERLP